MKKKSHASNSDMLRKTGFDTFWPVRDFGCQPYDLIQDQMQHWAESDASSEIWIGEHPIVVTQGVRARSLEISVPYPLKKSSRGGLLSLHLPGQLVLYPLYRYGPDFEVQRYVTLLEQVAISYLESLGVYSYRCTGAPGVYTSQGKIASLGLRTRHGGVIHGMSFNLCCSLKPFSFIESCGQKNMPITNLAVHGIFPMLARAKEDITQIFFKLLAQEFKV